MIGPRVRTARRFSQSRIVCPTGLAARSERLMTGVAQLEERRARVRTDTAVAGSIPASRHIFESERLTEGGE